MSRVLLRVVAWGFVFGAMSFGGSALSFFDVPSLLLVVFPPLLLVAGHHGLRGLTESFQTAMYPDRGTAAMIAHHVEILQSLRNLFCAFGGIGALIGLVSMLQNMSDPSAIGPAMAVALLTPLYGMVLAEGVLAPSIRRLNVSLLKRSDGANLPRGGQHPRGFVTLSALVVLVLVCEMMRCVGG